MTSTKRRGGGAINNQTPVKGGVSEVVTSAVRAVDICWPLVGTTRRFSLVKVKKLGWPGEGPGTSKIRGELLGAHCSRAIFSSGGHHKYNLPYALRASPTRDM